MLPPPFAQRVRRAPAAASAEVVASLRPRRPVRRVPGAHPGGGAAEEITWAAMQD